MGIRKWSEAEKKRVVLGILKGQKGVSQVAKGKGVSDALIYRWRDQALKAIDEAFSGSNGKQGPHTSPDRERL